MLELDHQDWTVYRIGAETVLPTSVFSSLTL